MDVAVIAVLIPVIFILGAIVVIVYVRKFENLERMAIIDASVRPHAAESSRREP